MKGKEKRESMAREKIERSIRQNKTNIANLD
jgi:hypothetical protein